MTISTAEAAALFRSPPEQHIDVGEGTVAYRRVGSGPDVLFVHGWPVHGATFRRLLPFLAEHVTCHLIDLPGTGSSRYDDSTVLSIDNHIESVRRTVDALGLERYAAVGHDSGGMIARHAVVDDSRLSALVLVNTEPASGPSWRFNSFIASSRLPGFGKILGWAAGKPAVRRNKFVLGDAFADRTLLDGDFDEFFLQPLANDPGALAAAMRIISTFRKQHLTDLAGIHARIDVPVRLVWGDQDPFFPIETARQDVNTFADATLVEVPGAGLFSHEEAPEAVADALLPTLTATS